MRHLHLVAVSFDPARDKADAALRQLRFDVFALGAEENEVKCPGVIFRRDLVGSLVVAARWRTMLQDSQLESCYRARCGPRDCRLCAPIDHPGGSMPDKIDDPRLHRPRLKSDSLLQQRHEPGADADQRLCGREKGREDIWAHATLLAFMSAFRMTSGAAMRDLPYISTFPAVDNLTALRRPASRFVWIEAKWALSAVATDATATPSRPPLRLCIIASM